MSRLSLTLRAVAVTAILTLGAVGMSGSSRFGANELCASGICERDLDEFCEDNAKWGWAPVIVVGP